MTGGGAAAQERDREGWRRYLGGVAGITLTMIYQRALERPSEAFNRHGKRLRGPGTGSRAISELKCLTLCAAS